MCTGILPIHLLDVQQQYYDYIGSKKTARKWSIDLVGKMLRAAHRLWMECNNILYLRIAGGIDGLEIICLDTSVTT